jgi:L-threonylcarbamoyladenylate synthase
MFMTTSTNGRRAMMHHYDLDGATATLADGGLILYPTDSIWSIGCDATDPVAVESIYRLKGVRNPACLELIVDSPQRILPYVDHLHPRLETLLLYHVRPLTILVENGRNLPSNLLRPDGTIAFRVAQDDYCRNLIAEYGKPLIAAYAAVGCEDYPSTFGMVSSTILQGVDFVARHRQIDKVAGEPSVMVRLTERDELEFLRE